MLYEKEKEISHMKLVLQQTKDQVDLRDGELRLLKGKTGQIEKEMMSLRVANITLQDKVDNMLLKCENNFLSNKTELMRLDKVVENIQCIDEDDINNLKVSVDEINVVLEEIKIAINSGNDSCGENFGK